MTKRSLLSLLILIVSLLVGIDLSAQQFPIDETGKIVFIEVIEVDSIKKEELFQNVTNLLNESKTKVKNKLTHLEKDSVNSKIKGDFKFMVYSQSGVLTKISGAITYTLSIEMKDNRYRYVFNDFVFHDYKQNRNYEYVETGVTKSLEDTKASGWQKLWNNHRFITYEKVVEEIKNLKIRILEKEQPPTTTPIAITTKKTDW